MKQIVSVVTLGVADLDRSREFYESLGWQPSKRSEIVTFWTPTVIVSLFARTSLAEDACVPESGGGFRGVALAICVQSRREVDEILGEAEAAGGSVVRAAGDTFWGGYSGYFSDPDGHLWEAAFHEGWEFDEDGRVRAL